MLTAMLRDHFARVHATPGLHLSALHASEPAIYGRHGYGMASQELEVEMARGATLTAPGLEADAARTGTALVDLAGAAVPGRLRAIEEAAAGPGSILGELDYYRRISIQLPEMLRGKEPSRVFVAARDGRDVGYAIFQRMERWDRGRPASRVRVRRVCGDPASRLALLRRLADLDLTGSVRIEGIGVDDGTVHWLGGPRGAQHLESYDGLWVRLVDLPEALQERGYAAACDVVVEVEDSAAPWNAGRWRIRVDASGRAQVTRSDAAADLCLPVTQLGAAYLGGTDLGALHRAGLVAERRPGAVAELWSAMRADAPPAAAIPF